MLTENAKKRLDRDYEIYYERIFEKRTLQAIADKYKMTRERVRQIVSKVKHLENVRAKLPENPLLIKDIEWPRRIYNSLFMANLTHITIQEFVEYCEQNNINELTNLGKKSVKEIKARLSQLNYEINTEETEKARIKRKRYQEAYGSLGK
jgi:DNA-directed RNA polymerase alpha subunit